MQKFKVTFYTLLEWPLELQNLCHFLFHETFNCTAAYISMNGPSILVEGHGEHANGGLGDSYDPLENKGPHCVHTFSFPHQNLLGKNW